MDIAALNTFSTVGKEVGVLDGYGEAELLAVEGWGCLTHMWFGGDWPGYERTLIRIYVDEDAQPSIEMELGLGHGCGFATENAPWGSEKLGRTGHPSGFYNAYKIPFGQRVRVTAQRATDAPDGAPFWWIVRGTHRLPVIYAGIRLPDTARLKLYRCDDRIVSPLEEFELCHVRGAGALYQVAMAAQPVRPTGEWKDLGYLEAMIRAYVNERDTPLFLSSGLEDYFLGTYYFNRGRYSNALAGLTHLQKERAEFSGYRFHDEDPVFFQDGLRLTCRCGEELNGVPLHSPPQTRFNTYTWVYEW